MSILANLILVLHIAAGITTLLTGPIALWFNLRNTKAHRLVGKIFFYAMVVVVISSIGGFIKHPHLVFYQFLLGIAVLVSGDILLGTRAMLFRSGKAQVGKFDYVYSILLGIFGLWMLGMAVWHLQQGSNIAFPILFGIFGYGAGKNAYRNLNLFRQDTPVSKQRWFELHITSMIGAFMASTTAFAVNVAHVLPWYIQWFGPTLSLLPLMFYFLRKVRRSKTTLVES